MKLHWTDRVSEKKQDVLVCCLIIIFSLIIWWPSRYLPYFWDSSGYVINTAYDILTKVPFNLASTHTNFAHPPLVTGLLALTWKLFGTSRLVSHLFMFPFLPLLLISTYYLAKKYLNSVYAMLATSLIAFTPVALAEYVNIYVDLPSAALAILAACFFVWKRPVKGIVAFTLAVLTKLPILTLLPFIAIKLKANQRWLLIIPLTATFFWLIYHQKMNGWLLIEPIRNTDIPKTPAQFIEAVKYIGETFFIDQGKYIWSIMAGIGLGILGAKKTLTTLSLHHHLDLITALAFPLGFFILTNEFAPRYSLFFLPFFAIGVVLLVKTIFNQVYLPLSALIIISLLLPVSQMLSWRGSTQSTARYEFNPPADLSIIDMIRIFRELSTTIEVHAPEAQIYGGFPEVQMLTQPIQGYVTKPLNFISCDQYVYDPDILQLIIVHPYAPSQFPCRTLLDTTTTNQLEHFEKNGKWVELYQVNASGSANRTTNPTW